MNRTTVMPLLLSLLLVSACGGGNPGACKSASDCAKGQTCTAGSCQQAPALAISPTTLPDAVAGETYGVSFSATGGVGAKTWSATGLPAWATLSADKGELTGVPDAADPGTSITVTATDSQGTKKSRDYTLVVEACQPNTTAKCYATQGSICQTGTATCGSDGTLGACTGGQASTDMAHCGPNCDACDATAANGCVAGACACNGGAVCASGQTCCGTGGCEDLNTDPNNCGSCGHKCTVTDPSTEVAACAAGQCQAKCATGFGRCNGPGTACVALNTVDNCGTCGNNCNALVKTAAANGKAACNLQNGTYQCAMACDSTYADCNGMMSDGCEKNLQADASCGSCNNDCTKYTNNGTGHCDVVSDPLVCTMSCVGSYADCDHNLTNGCEADLDTDAKNCHTCGFACPAEPHAIPSCTNGTCTPLRCSQGYADCDAVTSNGCEVDLQTDPNHCGSCSVQCSTGQACQGGKCCGTRVSSCVTGTQCCSGNCNFNTKLRTGTCQ